METKPVGDTVRGDISPEMMGVLLMKMTVFGVDED